MEPDAHGALVELGLTSTEASIYLAARDIGGGTAKEISVAAEKERGNTHHILTKLVRLGLVEASFESPTTFRPREVAEAIDNLYSMQAMKLKRLDGLRKEVSASLASSGLRRKGPAESYSIIKGRVNTYLRMVHSMQRSNQRVSMLLSAQGIRRLRKFNNFLSTMAKKSDEGVEFRIITEINRDNLEEVRAFAKVAEVRHVRNQATNASVYDRGVASVALSVNEGLEEDVREHVALWTNGVSFVKTLADFFNSVWFVAAPAEPTIRTLLPG
jgi:sugar-specific transcriptional regulator TrmB